MVRDSENEGCFQFEMYRQALKRKGLPLKLTEKRWQQQMSPERLLGRRKTFGGPAPSAVRETIDNLRDDLSKYRRWSRRQIERLDQARSNLRQNIEKAIK